MNNQTSIQKKKKIFQIVLKSITDDGSNITYPANTTSLSPETGLTNYANLSYTINNLDKILNNEDFGKYYKLSLSYTSAISSNSNWAKTNTSNYILGGVYINFVGSNCIDTITTDSKVLAYPDDGNNSNATRFNFITRQKKVVYNVAANGYCPYLIYNSNASAYVKLNKFNVVNIFMGSATNENFNYTVSNLNAYMKGIWVLNFEEVEE